MASLDKLAIRGIRSFDDKQTSVIEFFAPVTVIVGHNGSGKTTIIECLKYATTGEQPPNTGGGAFVHDPVLANEREVKAQVKLRFNAANGTRMLAVRNLQVSKKDTGGLTMTAPDNMLSLVDGAEGSKRATIPITFGEINAEIPRLLGVSKSVLNNVIFCHQEDSYWPLSGSSVLKKKFDDIFEATRYTKALDAIKALHKEREAKLKTDQERLESLSKEKTHADKLKGKIDDMRANIGTKDIQYEQIGAELKAVASTNLRFYDMSIKFKQTFIEVQALTEQLEDMDRQLAEITETTDVLPGSDEELQKKIGSFDGYRNDLYQRRNALQVEKHEAEENTASLQAIDKQLATERGVLKNSVQKHEKDLTKREELVRKLSIKHELAGFDKPGLDRAALIAFTNKLGEVQARREREVDSLNKEGKSKQEDMTARWQVLKADSLKVQESKDQLCKDLAKLHDALIDEERRLRVAEGGAAELLSAEHEHADKTGRLERARRDAEAAGYSKKIDELASRAREIDIAKEHLSKEQTALTLQSQSRARLDLRRTELDKTETEVTAILKTHMAKFCRLVGADAQADTMECEVDRVLRDKEAEVTEAQSEYGIASRRLSDVEGSLENLRSQLVARQAEMTDLEKKLSTAMGDAGLTVKAALDQAQEELIELTSTHSNKEAVMNVFEEIFAKSKNKKKCMTCDRAIGSHEMHAFDKYMERQLAKHKKAAEMPEEQRLEEVEEEIARLKKLLSKEDEKDRLKRNAIPELERQIREAEAKLPALTEEADKKQETLSQARRDLKDLEPLKLQATNVTRLRKVVVEAKREIEKLGEQLSRGEPLRSAETIEQEQQALIDEWRLVDNKQKSLISERECNSKEQSSLVASVHESQRRVEELRRQAEEAKKLELAVADYKKQEQDVKEQLKNMDSKVAEAERPLRELQTLQEVYKREFDERLRLAQAFSHEIARGVDQLDGVNKEIEAFVRLNQKAKLEEIDNDLETTQAAIEESKNNASRLQATLDEVIRDIGAADGQLQTLLSNVRIHNIRREIVAKREVLAGKDIEEAARARRRFDEEYPKARQKEVDLQNSYARLSGEIDSMKCTLVGLEKEMEDFKDIRQQYRSQLVKVKMSDMANNDLEKYAKALDHAIMKYHSLKMEEVNDTMRYLWNKTYQGTDIDGIKISADSEGESAAVRRSYNYRVVMTKDHTEMDMRGRCSAGQKMLASIIIRLALSDSFSQNCGILALDEPTIALDTENIAALASSLVDIINARKSNSNFQLIVITHDEQFLRKLGEANVMEYYWRVSRDMRQKSVIERQRFGVM